VATNNSAQSERIDGVLIIGGGYAGLHAAAAVRHAGVPVTVVDRTGQHDHVTRLAAVAGGTGTVEDASSPLRSFVESVLVGAVTNIEDGSVTLADGRTLQAQAVIVTAGSSPSSPQIEGIKYAHPLRSAEDALKLRLLIEGADSLVIIGGGATGVQLAGAVAVVQPSISVHLVEGSTRLLGSLPAELGAGAQRILEGRNVNLSLGASVEKVTEPGVVVDGTLLEGLVVWAGGSEALGDQFGLPTAENGRILLDPTLRVTGLKRTFAAGDTALHRSSNGEVLPMSAQVAVRAGAAAGHNAVRLLKSETLKSVDLRQLGWVLDLGGRRGLAQVGPVNLSQAGLDLIPPLLHEVIDLMGLFETGGITALRFASSSAKSLIPFRLPEWPFGQTATRLS